MQEASPVSAVCNRVQVRCALTKHAYQRRSASASENDMIYKTFTFWLCFIGFSVLALILANVPLFNLLGYEFSAVMALGIAFAGAFIAITVLQQMKRDPGARIGSPAQRVMRCFWQALAANVVILMAPLGIILLNAFRVQNCNIGEGLLFFGLLPGVSCLYTTAAGVFFGTWRHNRWKAFLSYIGYIVLTYIPLVINLVWHPPVFAYHATFGYFPGPIYDERIVITGTLLIARACTLMGALLFLSIAVNTCEVSRESGWLPRLKWRALLHFPSMRYLSVYFLAIIVFGMYLYAGELGMRPSREDIARKLGGFRETEHFEIYYATSLEGDIELIAQDCEFQYAELANYLGIETPQKVRAYIYASPEQKKRLIGAGSTSVEDPGGHGFHIHAQGFPHPVLKHELAHVFTVPWSPLKVSLKIGLHEGIAVAADWEEGRLTPHQWAKAMRQLQLAPSLSDIIGIGFWGQAGSRSYLLTGSFVRFLVDTHGIEKFIRVFPTGNFEKHYGKTLNVLEAEWATFLDSVPLSDSAVVYAKTRLQPGGIFEKHCAHEIAALRHDAWQAYRRRDFATAAKTFEQMLAFEPDNVRSVRGLMFSAYRMKDYERARILANSLAAAPSHESVGRTTKPPPGNVGRGPVPRHGESAPRNVGRGPVPRHAGSAQENVEREPVPRHSESAPRNVGRGPVPRHVGSARRAEAQILIGDIHWLKDEQAAATQAYLAVQTVDARMQRNVTKRLAALSEESEQKHLRSVLLSQESNAEKMARLFACKESPLTHFLAGELLHREGAWEMSNQRLKQAVALNENATSRFPQLMLEATRLIGLNAYRLADYATAENAFSAIAEDETLPLGTVLNAQTWIRRCQWRARTQ